MIVITVKVPEPLRRAAQEAADRLGVTLSDVVRSALEFYLARLRGGDGNPPSPLTAAAGKERRRWRCLICGAEFGVTIELAKHIRREHAEGYGRAECPVCGKRFRSERSVASHAANRRDAAHRQLLWALSNGKNKRRHRRAWIAMLEEGSGTT